MSGKPRQPAVSPAEELRELTRDAHAAAKDLRHAIMQARTLADKVTVEMIELMKGAANEQMRQSQQHMQREADRNSVRLHQAVERARHVIVKALTPEVLEPLADSKGSFRVIFRSGNFVPLDEEMLDEEVSDEQEGEAQAQAGADPAAAVDTDAADRGQRP